MQHKPPACKLCPFASIGYGFLPDKAGTYKVAIMAEAPSSDDLTMGEAFSDGLGEHFMWRCVEHLGRERSDILVTFAHRCRRPNKLEREERVVVPTQTALFGTSTPGSVKNKVARWAVSVRDHDLAAANCRQHDRIVHDYSPNLFIITYGLDAGIKTPALSRILEEHLRKAFRFADRGYHPMVLLGETAGRLVWPYPFLPGNGGLQQWAGHYWEGSWPFRLTQEIS